MTHGEKAFRTHRDSERKIMDGEGKNGCKKRGMRKMGGAKGQGEAHDSITSH